MEFGGASDGVLVSLQRATSLCDRGVEIVDGCEMSIDERLVDEGPKVLCRLQLRAVGGLEDQPDAVGPRTALHRLSIAQESPPKPFTRDRRHLDIGPPYPLPW